MLLGAYVAEWYILLGEKVRHFVVVVVRIPWVTLILWGEGREGVEVKCGVLVAFIGDEIAIGLFWLLEIWVDS